MSSDDSAKGALASTACWMAAVRARESECANHLFSDPWAALLAGQAGQVWVDRAAEIRPESAPVLVVRTKFFDDFLLRAITQHQVRQVVLVAAGMDTRAFRLPSPEGTRLFELDQPEVLVQKELLLSSAGASPTCWRQTIEIDLREPWADALHLAGFDPLQRSVWLVEGLLRYLPLSSVIRLLEIITNLSASDSWLGFDVVNRDMLVSPQDSLLGEFLEKSDIPWVSSMDEPEALLAEHGWTATVVQFGEESANFGRWPYPIAPHSVLGIPRQFFVTATYTPNS